MSGSLLQGDALVIKSTIANASNKTPDELPNIVIVPLNSSQPKGSQPSKIVLTPKCQQPTKSIPTKSTQHTTGSLKASKHPKESQPPNVLQHPKVLQTPQVSQNLKIMPPKVAQTLRVSHSSKVAQALKAAKMTQSLKISHSPKAQQFTMTSQPSKVPQVTLLPRPSQFPQPPVNSQSPRIPESTVISLPSKVSQPSKYPQSTVTSQPPKVLQHATHYQPPKVPQHAVLSLLSRVSQPPVQSQPPKVPQHVVLSQSSGATAVLQPPRVSQTLRISQPPRVPPTFEQDRYSEDDEDDKGILIPQTRIRIKQLKIKPRPLEKEMKNASNKVDASNKVEMRKEGRPEKIRLRVQKHSVKQIADRDKTPTNEPTDMTEPLVLRESLESEKQVRMLADDFKTDLITADEEKDDDTSERNKFVNAWVSRLACDEKGTYIETNLISSWLLITLLFSA